YGQSSSNGQMMTATMTVLPDTPSNRAAAPAPSRGSAAPIATYQTRTPEASAPVRPSPARTAIPTGGDPTGIAVGIDADGQVITSGDFRGRVVVLDFWATWCGPCKASSPSFQRLSDRFAGDSRVIVLAIHTDDSGDPKAYMRQNGYTFRMVPRGQEFARRYGVSVLPTFIVLDQRGREIYRDMGMMGESQRAEVEGIVRSALR
ncbi:MAG: TlpA family protein disulfide reductase, partial [Phycisphaerales bacterium]|nr:TlpA family protein disulfide reductase [Phycisphaerales bacterium]